MCYGTHSNAGMASTKSHVSDSGNSSAAKLSTESDNSASSHLSSFNLDQQEQEEMFSPGMDSSANNIHMAHLNVDDLGLLLTAETLQHSVFKPGEEVSLVVLNNTAVITTDPLKRSLLKSAEELQLRQDELKEDFSIGIVQLLKSVWR